MEKVLKRASTFSSKEPRCPLKPEMEFYRKLVEEQEYNKFNPLY